MIHTTGAVRTSVWLLEAVTHVGNALRIAFTPSSCVFAPIAPVTSLHLHHKGVWNQVYFKNFLLLLLHGPCLCFIANVMILYNVLKKVCEQSEHCCSKILFSDSLKAINAIWQSSISKKFTRNLLVWVMKSKRANKMKGWEWLMTGYCLRPTDAVWQGAVFWLCMRK